jgi:tetratricopeptide (TPR) repeat protein
MVGSTIAHYQVTAKLGAGGMGEVYRATDTRLGREVALKLLPAADAQDAAARARLIAEARNASALNHPHICHIYEVNEAAGVAYFAMELAEGAPLSRRIPPGGLPVETVVRYGEQIAGALAHAHERGILHRDLKSGNVMVTPAGQAKVLDFGLAQRLTKDELAEVTRSKITVQQAGAIAGTLAYLAPEVLGGQGASERSDIWALGVVLHEMATGTMPFEGRTGYELTSAILREPPRTAETAPPAMRAVIARCLAKEPGQRYQKAAEVRAALEVIGSTTQTQVAVQAGQAAESRTKKMWVAAGVVAAVGLALAIAQPWKRAAEPVQSEPAPAGGQPLGTTFLIKRPSQNAEANELLQRAMMFTRFQLDPLRARPLVERALRLDPNFTEARINYGLTYIAAVESGISNHAGDIYRAEEELRRALKEDPEISRAHALLGAVHLFQGRTDLANQELDLAARLSSQELAARLWRLIQARFLGNTEAAAAAGRELIEAEPLFWVTRYQLAEVLREQGKTSEAVKELEKVLEQDPQNVSALRCLARAYLDAGDPLRARQTLGRMRPQDGENFRVRMVRAQLYALEGNRAAALKEMDEPVMKYADLQPLGALDTAEIYAVLGEKEKAIEWLDRSMRKGDGRVDWIRRDPLLASLREHPRFQQILTSMEFRRQQSGTAAPKTQ